MFPFSLIFPRIDEYRCVKRLVCTIAVKTVLLRSRLGGFQNLFARTIGFNPRAGPYTTPLKEDTNRLKVSSKGFGTLSKNGERSSTLEGKFWAWVTFAPHFTRTCDRHTVNSMVGLKVFCPMEAWVPSYCDYRLTTLHCLQPQDCMLSEVMGVSKTWVPGYCDYRLTALHCRGQHPLVKHTKSYGRSALRGISQPRFNLRKKYLNSTLEILIWK